MQAREQRPCSAASQLASPVRDVRVKHGRDPRPVRRDQPLVKRAELGRDGQQLPGRVLVQRGRALRPGSRPRTPGAGLRAPRRRGLPAAGPAPPRSMAAAGAGDPAACPLVALNPSSPPLSTPPPATPSPPTPPPPVFSPPH